MRKVYDGFIKLEEPGEAYDIIFIGDSEQPFVEQFEEDLEEHGNYVTVRYFITDSKMSETELTEELIKRLSGSAEAEYGHVYSEYTGYLWTNQKLIVGGHDLVEEIKASNSRYIFLEVEFSKGDAHD